MTTFRLATESDDSLIRSILRDNGMPTWVEMTVEHEPSFFAGKNLFGREWAVIAEESGSVIGMYTAALLPVHVDGQPELLGYLGGLRVNRGHRRQVRHLREGYASIRPLAPTAGTLPWWFTVVAAANVAARRLLEAGVAGLPPYHLLGEYNTFGVPTARGRRSGLWRRARDGEMQRILEFHNAQAVRFQLSPVLHEAAVRHIGLDRFFVHERANVLLGVAALWDQRAFKQVVARRYRRPIGALISAYNAYAKLLRRIPLPVEGGMLAQTCIAFLVFADEVIPEGRTLLQDLLSHCETPVASIGLHAKHALVPALTSFRPMRYPARIYAVSFGECRTLAKYPAQPEAALL